MVMLCHVQPKHEMVVIVSGGARISYEGDTKRCINATPGTQNL